MSGVPGGLGDQKRHPRLKRSRLKTSEAWEQAHCPPRQVTTHMLLPPDLLTTAAFAGPGGAPSTWWRSGQYTLFQRTRGSDSSAAL